MMPSHGTAKNYGATPSDWSHFAYTLDLGPELLPVVSNPLAQISPDSDMVALGKTPSRYNKQGHAVGIAKWTQLRTGESDIDRWSRVPDYGICVQTRRVRAIDIDIADEARAAEVRRAIEATLGIRPPVRYRRNTGKCLLLVTLPDLPGTTYAKRTIRTLAGIVEFLATGQQFIAVGTHPSGQRYEWEGGLPAAIPTVTPEQFEALWSALQAEFGVAPSATSKSAVDRNAALTGAAERDPVAQALHSKGMVLSQGADGRLNVECPWSDEHTTDSSETATIYWPAHTGGFEHGSFKCLHAHCADRSLGDLENTLGVIADMFDDLDAEPTEKVGGDSEGNSSIDANEFDDLDQDTPAKPEKPKKDVSGSKFVIESVGTFLDQRPLSWVIKGVLPMAELILLYGAPASGKTFVALDLAAAVCQGIDWRGFRTKRGRVLYIIAEGQRGFALRLRAYQEARGVTLDNMCILPVPPNLLVKEEALELAAVVVAWMKANKGDPIALVVIDTMAQTMPGGDENTGTDVGTYLAHAKGLGRVTKAPVMLVHHTGKDASRGARGWSGLAGAADAAFEVRRDENVRALVCTKMKDGNDDQAFGFELETIDLGADEDGDAITSCVVKHLDVVPVGMSGRRSRNFGRAERAFIAAFDILDAEGGARIPIEQVIAAALPTLDEPEQGKRDRRRYALLRAFASLKEHKYFTEERGCVVRAEEPVEETADDGSDMA